MTMSAPHGDLARESEQQPDDSGVKSLRGIARDFRTVVPPQLSLTKVANFFRA
jgi:hypothetical protein